MAKDKKGFIKGYPNYIIYENGVIYNKHGKLMKFKNRRKGYKAITLHNKGIPKTFLIHRLVMINFKYKEGCELLDVNHIDGNPSNNNIVNLEWCTRKENMEHAVKLGLVKRGEKHHLSIITDSQIIEIKKLNNLGIKQIDIAKQFGIDPSTVSRFISQKIGGRRR